MIKSKKACIRIRIWSTPQNLIDYFCLKTYFSNNFHKNSSTTVQVIILLTNGQTKEVNIGRGTLAASLSHCVATVWFKITIALVNFASVQ